MSKKVEKIHINPKYISSDHSNPSGSIVTQTVDSCNYRTASQVPVAYYNGYNYMQYTSAQSYQNLCYSHLQNNENMQSYYNSNLYDPSMIIPHTASNSNQYENHFPCTSVSSEVISVSQPLATSSCSSSHPNVASALHTNKCFINPKLYENYVKSSWTKTSGDCDNSTSSIRGIDSENNSTAHVSIGSSKNTSYRKCETLHTTKAQKSLNSMKGKITQDFQKKNVPENCINSQLSVSSKHFKVPVTQLKNNIYVSRTKLVRNAKQVVASPNSKTSCAKLPQMSVIPPKTSTTLVKKANATAVFVSNTKLVRSHEASEKVSTSYKHLVNAKTTSTFNGLRCSLEKNLSPVLKTRDKIIRNHKTKVKATPSTISKSSSFSSITHQNLRWTPSSGYSLNNNSYRKLSRKYPVIEPKKIVASSRTSHQKAFSLKNDRFINIGGAMYKTTAMSLQKHVAQPTRTKDVVPFHSKLERRRWHHGTAWSKCWRAKSSVRSPTFPSLTWVKFSSSGLSSQVMSVNHVKHRYKINNTTRGKPMLHSNRNSFTWKKNASIERTLKVQAQQRIIAAAKQRSLVILRARCYSSFQRKNLSLVKRDSNVAKLAANSVSGVDSSNAKTYCRFYHRYGKCIKGSKCPFGHNPDRVAICTRFLRGNCRDSSCLFAHTLDKGRMPVCSHFLKDALCTRENCPYLHVKPNSSAPVCEHFLHGHCDKKEKCELQHVLECVEHRELGKCSRPKCPLPHPKHRQKKPQAKKALPKRRRSRRLSAVLGDDSQKKAFSQPTSKQSIPSRYFDNKEKEKNISQERREPEKKLVLLGEKRERIMKLINGMKERNKGSISTRNYVPTTAGKNNIVDGRDSIFVEPLPQYLGRDLSLPNFIPLDSSFKKI